MDRSNPGAHLYVLPWIQLKEPLAFGRVEISPASQCLDDADPRTEAARRIVATYRDLGDQETNASLMWVTGGGPLDLEQSDFEDLLLHRMCLSAGLIMNNTYFSEIEFVPTTEAHCEAFFHRFSADGAHVSIEKRRRDGRTLDGWPLDKVKMTVPLSASSHHTPTIDRTLLDALVAVISGGSELGRTLERALPPFLQGNRLSEANTVLDDLVWMGAAFERLLGVTNDVGRTLSCQVAELLAGATEGATEWVHMSRNGNPQPESGPWRQRWMREFYDRRSDLHSGAGAEGEWSDYLHGVIAAEVFSLAVIKLMHDAGHRQIREIDEVRMDALDARIEGVATDLKTVRDAWSDGLLDAGLRRVVAAMVASFHEEVVPD